MDSATSGTFVGAGSFRCERCGYTLTLEGSDILTDCPSCGNATFARASMFATARITAADRDSPGEPLAEPVASDRAERLLEAREGIEGAGDYLCYEEGERVFTVALKGEWTRIGRSLAADVRFDDPTVSRRHALIVRQPDGVRLLDDRSLNGVFVNGRRVDGQTLNDGDEIIVGRYRLAFVSIPLDGSATDGTAGVAAAQGALHTVG